MANLKKIAKEAEKHKEKVNNKIRELGEYGLPLYESITELQRLFAVIGNKPSDVENKLENLQKQCVNWKQQAKNIENDIKNAKLKIVGKGGAVLAGGIGVAAFGPAAAMGIATTFGVASTGTAISALSGAAATNAALAWLGGGAIAVGGGGISAGTAFLALAGPLGWAIGIGAVITSVIMFFIKQNQKDTIDDIFKLICKRDINYNKLAIAEINERKERIKQEVQILSDAANDVKTMGTDYTAMTENQQYRLGTYVNLMNSSLKLLTEPIAGLQSKFNDEDLQSYFIWKNPKFFNKYDSKQKKMITTLAAMLYNIDLDKDSKHILYKALRNNKKFIKSYLKHKDDFEEDLLDRAISAAKWKRQNRNV